MMRALVVALLLVISLVVSGCQGSYWCSDGGGEPRYGQRGEDEHQCSDSEMTLAGYERVCGQIRGPRECWWER
jgi:hypothetical protein